MGWVCLDQNMIAYSIFSLYRNTKIIHSIMMIWQNNFIESNYNWRRALRKILEEQEHIFISMRTLIHRVFSRKLGYYTRLQKSGICIFILCALSATRNCVFSCQKKKKNWDD